MASSTVPTMQQHDNSDIFDAPPNQPNSSKRRPRPADLQRQDATPSRIDKLREIFEDAACHLASTPPPTGYTIRYENIVSDNGTANVQPIRLSVHKTNSDYWIDPPRVFVGLPFPYVIPSRPESQKDCQGSTASAPTKLTEELLSSHRNTPSRIPRFIGSPSKNIWKTDSAYGMDSDDEDIHSTHGVPLIMPFRKPEPDPRVAANNVRQWLESMDHEKKAKNSCASTKSRSNGFQHNSKGKENIPPSADGEIASGTMLPENTHASQKKARLLAAEPSRHLVTRSHTNTWHSISHQNQMASSSSPKGTTPTGLLSKPPRRVGPNPGISEPMKTSKKHDSKTPERILHRVENLLHSPEPSEVVDEDDLRLSPGVTQHRRGRRIQAGKTENRERKQVEAIAPDVDLSLVLSLQEYESSEEHHRGHQSYRF